MRQSGHAASRSSSRQDLHSLCAQPGKCAVLWASSSYSSRQIGQASASFSLTAVSRFAFGARRFVMESLVVDFGERQIPVSWNAKDRHLYLELARKRQNEHVLGFSLVGIGAQLFLQAARIPPERKEAEISSCNTK